MKSNCIKYINIWYNSTWMYNKSFKYKYNYRLNYLIDEKKKIGIFAT